MTLDNKDKLKAMIKAKKICRQNEISVNNEKNDIKKKINDKTLSKKQKEWYTLILTIIDEHLETSEENQMNKTIPMNIDY
jgi:hypothetical protein